MAEGDAVVLILFSIFIGLPLLAFVQWWNRCWVYDCPHGQAEGSWWCAAHKCVYCSELATRGCYCGRHVRYCSEVHCTAVAPSSFLSVYYCERHRCLCCSGRATLGPFCLSHIRHCSSFRCHRVQMRNSEYCSEHYYCTRQHCSAARPANSEYCSAHQCVSCTRGATGGPFCSLHVQYCSKVHCHRVRGRDSIYCEDHSSCAFTGCSLPRPDNSDYCTAHQCTFCLEGATRGPYCKTHAEYCAKPTCNNVREPPSTYCSQHKCCKKRGCMSARPTDSDFCQEHQCAMCSNGATKGPYCASHACARDGCTAARPSNANYCDTHRCVLCPRLAVIGPYCTDHVEPCTHVGCGGVRCRGAVYCRQHQQCRRRGCTNARQPNSETCVACGNSGSGILSVASPTAFWEQIERATPSADEVAGAKQVVDLFHKVLSPHFPGAVFIKGGSLAKGTGIRRLMDVDLVLQIPGLSLSGVDACRRNASRALRQHGFEADDSGLGHVIKAKAMGYDVDVVITSTLHKPGEWWTVAASSQEVLKWFSSLCEGCPQFPLICRALKLWRHEITQAASRAPRTPPCYALEVVAAEVRNDRRFGNVTRPTLPFYYAESLRHLRGHLARGSLPDPVNHGNDLLLIMRQKEPTALAWWQAKIDSTLRKLSWVQVPPSWQVGKHASGICVAQLFPGQQVLAKYRAKSGHFKPATVVMERGDNTVGVRFDGYEDVVLVPLSRIRKAATN